MSGMEKIRYMKIVKKEAWNLLQKVSWRIKSSQLCTK